MKEKIQALLEQLNMGLVEREYTLKSALLTVLAGENLVLIGPPGTGKSLIARRIAESIAADDNGRTNCFEYLLTKFSTPEEIFGPLSITELKADRFKRNTEGYLPTVKVAFLDEIFKASSSILNSLLTIMNEHIYHNGANPEKVPLRTLIGASNELPNDQDELQALYDRFLVRIFVDYVSDNNFSLLFENMAEPELTAANKLGVNDFDYIHQATSAVNLSPEIVQAIQKIWLAHKETFKEDRRENLSDRRLKKIIHLLRVSAATNGRTEVDLSDVFLLKDCLWNHQDNAIKVRELVMGTLRRFSRLVPVSEDAPADNLSVMGLNDDNKVIMAQSSIPALAVKTESVLLLSDAKSGSLVKGFKGSGTASDPLLVDTVDHLAELARMDVGQHDYHFLQTADLDCSSVSTWPKITFKGHYDGCGHSITLKNSYLFETILQSTISGVKLSGCSLAKDTQDHSAISDCQTDKNLLNVSDNCKITDCKVSGALIGKLAKDNNITGCESGGVLVSGGADSCVITHCKAGGELVRDNASKCIINMCQAVNSIVGGSCSNNTSVKDCFVFISLAQVSGRRGGIAGCLTTGSIIEKCFVTGGCAYSGNSFLYFSGIADKSSDSYILRCAIGLVNLSSSDVRFCPIINEYVGDNAFKENVIVDSNKILFNDFGSYTKIASALFKQRYFENTLGWDFDNIWMWDDKENRPALRAVGVGAAGKVEKPLMPKNPEADLLTLQIRNNIWL